MVKPNIRYKCSGVDQTPSSPGEGLAPLEIESVLFNGITPYNNKRFYVGRNKYKCTTIPALWAGWRQVAAATVGCTIFWVVPFNGTG